MKKLSIVIILLLSCNYYDAKEDKRFSSTLGYLKSNAAVEDVNYLFQKLEDVHYNPYLHISRKQLHSEKLLLLNKWQKRDSIMTSEFIIETMKLLSKIEDGHTKLVWYSQEILPKRDSIGFFPIQMKLDEERDLKIIDAKFSQYEEEKVASINGMDAKSLYKESLQCLSSNFEHKNELASSLFFPVFLHLKGLTAPYAIVLESKHEIQIDGSESAHFIDLYKRLQPSNKNYEYSFIKEGIGLISYNSCTDFEAFEEFLSTSFEKIKRDNVKDLIIDIRSNSGGNSALNDLLLGYITEKKYRQSSKRLWKLSDVSVKELEGRGLMDKYGKDFIEKHRLESDSTILMFGEGERPQAPRKVDHYFEGDSYLLIGPKTYSSANMLADAVSTYGLFTIIGTSTGERTNDFGEQKTELLPQTNFPFDYTIAFDIGADGNETIIKTVEPNIKTDGDALEFAINLILEKRLRTKANNG